MTFIDDNYLDGIITQMTAEHKEKIMRTAKRLNLPDDDVLFLYIGAVEYTVQLCEDVLGGISSERQRIEQSSQSLELNQQQQSQNLTENLIRAGRDIVKGIQSAGSAATSAIAEANTEVLNQSRATVTEAAQLKEELLAYRATVETDRQTNKNVLEGLLKRIGQITGGLETAISQINGANTTIAKLQRNTVWIKFADWFSPLMALAIVALVGFGSGSWVMSLKYNDSTNTLGRNLVQWNLDRLLKCREDENPKCTLWIVSPELRK
ncbi:MAG: hypothetical protein CLLPBCKN_008614 [Chroococcidiopsis cubana SAG 39.79]|uniref:Uncharacterized protein n=1 Tax=Chroococcidiopsis cubana SAG 39.79 TaxID=388085 RepID=A0AB37UAP4_9CYAN|nr:hypothetical protein [Chroococcidiopsis cubana]MDZ4879176.1 hypothetical protein [Chroococcidiopsis cubana SAG 39.79]PSB66168.1 hypothetical protein C7B79_02255 [Chroococcidiopsis cubana CCALA 043]RUT03347.1 hypothetical protein DSM107010_60710 [Chroococcidiopsis cubana SAG 39.79]